MNYPHLDQRLLKYAFRRIIIYKDHNTTTDFALPKVWLRMPKRAVCNPNLFQVETERSAILRSDPLYPRVESLLL